MERRDFCALVFFGAFASVRLLQVLVIAGGPWQVVGQALLLNGALAGVFAGLLLILLPVHRIHLRDSWVIGGAYTLLVSTIMFALTKWNWLMSGFPWILIFYSLIDSLLWLICFYTSLFIASRLTKSPPTLGAGK